MSKFNVGDKVIAISKQAHKDDPEAYPKVGTIGYVQEAEGGSKLYKVQWQLGSTSCNDLWYAREDEIELFNRYMTNEEIWEMLRPKMEKNWLVPHWGDKELAYYQSDVTNAIAIAYRSGYERAMKGRPFKIGEKKNEEKKGGHWEPVDPNNLPKEGTRVRYSRECKDYKNCESEIVIGDTGVVRFEGLEHDWFGIKPDNPRKLYYNWLSFDDDSAGCLDMWVEDDE